LSQRKRILSLALTLGLLGVNLVVFNALIAGWSTARVDLTEDRVFSISPATERILASLDDNLSIRGYFSQRTHPKLAPLIPEIVDLLDEYRALSGGRVQVEIIDPGEDEAAEQEASERFGVTSTPFQLASKYETGIVNAYFALVIQYGDQYQKYGFADLIAVERLPGGDIEVRLRNLEYDLTRAIKKAVYGFRGTAELFDQIDVPVHFTALISEGTLPEIFGKIPEAVRNAAQELTESASGGFTFEELDPSAEGTNPDEIYRRFGAQPMSLGLFGDTSFYLYGMLQVGNTMEPIPITDASLTQATVRESIEASLRRQVGGFLKTVGLVTPSPQLPPEVLMQYQMQGMQPRQPPPEFQQVRSALSQEYEVRSVSLAGAGVPAEVDILVVLKPKDLSTRAVYHLDQYLMRGGRVVLCAENFEARFQQTGLQVTPVNTGLDSWLDHFGIRIPQDLVLDDQNQPLPIPETRRTPLGMMQTWRLAPYPYLVEVRDAGLVDAAVVSDLDAVGIYWGSPVEVDPEKLGDLTADTVLQSSDRSWTSQDLDRVAYVDYEVPADGTRPHTLAVAIHGRFPSYFADKEVPPASPPTPPLGGEEVEPPAPSEVTLEESPETRMLVVGNAAFLSDFVARALGPMEGGFFAQNLRFLENAIDWMSLDSDMVGIRSRGVAARRLGRTEKRAEMTIESINYLIPAIVLLSVAFLRHWRRRHVAPLVSGWDAGKPAAQFDGEVSA
jgi:ABC-type uncharacterized transport system involved in gliding motility auxiliary subunit